VAEDRHLRRGGRFWKIIEDDGFRRLLHRADDTVSDPLCVPGAGSRPPPGLHVAVTAHPRSGLHNNSGRHFRGTSTPQYLLRDRDGIFGREFTSQVKELGIQEVLGAPHVPQQRAYIERIIGTIRRECLDHVIVYGEASLIRHLRLFLAYYHETRTYLALDKDTPAERAVQLSGAGRIVAVSQVGGLHHRHERRVA
jgi:transposase InsO family protein